MAQELKGLIVELKGLIQEISKGTTEIADDEFEKASKERGYEHPAKHPKSSEPGHIMYNAAKFPSVAKLRSKFKKLRK